VVDVDNVQFGAGSDEERSAVPQDSTMSHNLFVHTASDEIFTVYDDMSGIAFDGNVVSGFPAPDFSDGFQNHDVTLAREENGLLYPVGLPDVGIRRDLKVTTKAMTGVSWFPKNEPIIPFGSGKTIKIDGGDGALFDAIQAAGPGDIIQLKANDYNVPTFLRVDKPITIKGIGDVAISFERRTLFEIVDGGSLRLENVKISGNEAPDNIGNTVIRTSPSSVLINYRVEIVDSEVSDINVNRYFHVIKGSKGTFADHILIQNAKISNVSGSVIQLTDEIDDKGIYGAEYITVENSTFTNIDGPIFNIYRGGKDESTFGPHVGLSASTITDSGHGKDNEANATLRLHGVQVTDIEDTMFRNSGALVIEHTVGEPKTRIVGNMFDNSAGITVLELTSGLPPTALLLRNEGLISP
jgi:poly(beta-D-mannuronate) lyase